MSLRNNLFKENNAQAGAVFRLMVDAIIGLVILLTILSALSYFEQQKISVGLKEFESVIYSAVNAPDGKIVESGGLSFLKGTVFTSTGLEVATGYKAECFNFQTGVTTIQVSDSAVRILQNIDVKVYAQCQPSIDCDSDCLFCCMISFGKRIEN